MLPRPLASVTVLGLLLGGLAAGCSTGGEDSPAPTGSSTGSGPAVSAAPLETVPAVTTEPFDIGEAVWRARDAPLDEATLLHVGADALLVAGRVPERDEALAVLTRPEGEVRWQIVARSSIGKRDVYPRVHGAVLGPERGSPVVVPVLETRCRNGKNLLSCGDRFRYRVGIRVHDARDGRLRWRWFSGSTRITPRVLAADHHGLTVVEVASERSGRVIAFDAATGDRRWQVDTVGTGARIGNGHVGVVLASGHVLLDVETGMPVWKGDDGEGLMAATADAVMTLDSTATARVVDLESGDDVVEPFAPEIADFTGLRQGLGEPMLAWFVDGDQYTLAAGEWSPVVATSPDLGIDVNLGQGLIGVSGEYVLREASGLAAPVPPYDQERSLVLVGRDGTIAGNVDLGTGGFKLTEDWLLLTDQVRPDQRPSERLYVH